MHIQHKKAVQKNKEAKKPEKIEPLSWRIPLKEKAKDIPHWITKDREVVDCTSDALEYRRKDN